MRASIALSLAVASAASSAVASVGAQQNRSGIAGVVRDSIGTPIPLASVFVGKAKATAVTDDSGHFDVRGLPSGANDVTITKVGYAPVAFSATLPETSVVVVSIKMHRVQTLEPVNVEATGVSPALRRVGFVDRQHAGWGTFLTPARIDSMADRLLNPSEFLRQVRGIDVKCGTLTCIPSPRIARCLSLFVDGTFFRSAGQMDSLGFGPSEVSAIEVYDVPSTVPTEFQRPGNCAVIVLWTKTHVPR